MRSLIADNNIDCIYTCVGGALLLELNRVLRPGGFFVWSATPVYQKLPEDVEIWKGTSFLNDRRRLNKHVSVSFLNSDEHF